ncbi:MAG: hypothetical protein ABL895_19100 [Cyclobacteriaceae bacterium]
MKTFFTIVSLMISLSGFGQKETETTTSFIISGDVKTQVTVSLTEFSKYNEAPMGDITITNHLGEKKSEQKLLKGILLKDILKTVEINNENPRVLSEYYFVCKSSDGYKVVYSWNEIFNSSTGESVYLVTSKNGQGAKEMKETILMISPKDYMTGRRYLKSLSSVEVKRAQ